MHISMCLHVCILYPFLHIMNVYVNIIPFKPIDHQAAQKNSPQITATLWVISCCINVLSVQLYAQLDVWTQLHIYTDLRQNSIETMHCLLQDCQAHTQEFYRICSDNPKVFWDFMAKHCLQWIGQSPDDALVHIENQRDMVWFSSGELNASGRPFHYQHY